MKNQAHWASYLIFPFSMYLLKTLRLVYAPKDHQLSHCVKKEKKENKDLSYVMVHKVIQMFANKCYITKENVNHSKQ